MEEGEEDNEGQGVEVAEAEEGSDEVHNNK